MKLFILAIFITPLLATNSVYIAQASQGSGNGTSCGNAEAVSYFNTAGNWSATPTGIQIGPDTTVHLCGTFTGTSNTTMLTFQGSGSSGHPIIIESDPMNCADLTAPYWAVNGAIYTNTKDFLVIDGQGTGDPGAIPSTFVACGVIENTANGSALANKQSSKGISIPSGSNVTVQGWYIHNIYQRSGVADDNVSFGLDDTSVNCMYFGAGSAIATIVVQYNSMINAGWCLNEIGGTTATVAHNEFGGMEHSLIIAPATVYVFNNHFRDSGIWDSTSVSLPYHHDFWHCFASSGGQVQSLYYYNNQADGNTGQNYTQSGVGQFNQVLYMEGNGSATSCMLPGGSAYIFNNVGIIQYPAPGDILDTGNSTTKNAGDLIVNNTTVGPTGAPNGSPIGINVQASHGATVENNAATGYATLFGGTQNATFSAIDYNAYQNSTGGNTWDTATINCGGSSCDTGSFTTWKTGTCNGSANTCDQHGIANVASASYFGLNANCTLGSVGQSCALLVGSPLIASGVNLFSVCNGQPIPGLGALCFDKMGVARPSSVAWDIGAYQYVPPPSGGTKAGPTGSAGPRTKQ